MEPIRRSWNGSYMPVGDTRRVAVLGKTILQLFGLACFLLLRRPESPSLHVGCSISITHVNSVVNAHGLLGMQAGKLTESDLHISLFFLKTIDVIFIQTVNY